MPVSGTVLDSDAVAEKARALWPHLDVIQPGEVTLLALLEAWQEWAEALAGTPFGTRRLLAVACLVAHAVTWATAGDAPAGPVTALTTLSLSASFVASTDMSSDDALRATRPGAMYLALRGSTPAITLPRVIL